MYARLVIGDIDDDDDDDNNLFAGLWQSPRCPWKNCAVQGFDCFQNRALSAAQRHGRQLSQTVTFRIAHAEAWNFFAQFFVF